MARTVSPRRAPTAADPDARVSCATGPAWVIEPATGRVVSANPQGAALIGMTSTGGFYLDAAMPGLARLRALLRDEQNRYHKNETLLLWTRRGAIRLTCDVHLILPCEDAQSALLLVEKSEMEAAAPDGAPRDEESPAPRDDAETLREIARRIRAGRGQPQDAAMGEARDTEPPREPARRKMSDPQQDDPASPSAATGPDTPGSAMAHAPDSMAQLAHELKTPLSAIAVAAEIMRDERFGPIGDTRYRSYAADIHNSARHALDLITRMLAARTQDAPSAPFEFVEIDVNTLVGEALSTIRPLAEQSRLSLTGALAPRLPHVIADATSLRQILLNLVTNALKFTPPGGAIEVATEHDTKGAVVIVVSDNGPGIAADDLARALAAPVQTAAPSEPRQKGGLGIGLPLAAALAAANGATLSIESAPGSGTTASVVFPGSRVVPV